MAPNWSRTVFRPTLWFSMASRITLLQSSVYDSKPRTLLTDRRFLSWSIANLLPRSIRLVHQLSVAVYRLMTAFPKPSTHSDFSGETLLTMQHPSLAMMVSLRHSATGTISRTGARASGRVEATLVLLKLLTVAVSRMQPETNSQHQRRRHPE